MFVSALPQETGTEYPKNSEEVTNDYENDIITNVRERWGEKIEIFFSKVTQERRISLVETERWREKMEIFFSKVTQKRRMSLVETEMRSYTLRKL